MNTSGYVHTTIIQYIHYISSEFSAHYHLLHKHADWDILEARFAELHEVRMPQKRDLTSLCLERAGILSQSVELSQASKPESEERLLRKQEISSEGAMPCKE